MALNMAPEFLWEDRVEFWGYRDDSSDRAFRCSGMKPLSCVDFVDVDSAQADSVYEIGKKHHVFPADAALKVFRIDFFFDGDGGIAEVAQPKVPYKDDLWIFGISVTFIASGDRIMCGITMEETHGDSGGTVEVAVIGLYDDCKGGYSVSPFSISEDGIYCSDFETLNDLGHWLGHFFCGVQYKMMNRPEFVRISHRRIPKEAREQAARHKGRGVRLVKVQKVISILAEEDADIPVSHTKHTITMPVWGVSGHWRTCKSGKRVWVRPHKKGRDRDKPDAYCGKKYQFVEEAVTDGNDDLYG